MAEIETGPVTVLVVQFEMSFSKFWLRLWVVVNICICTLTYTCDIFDGSGSCHTGIVGITDQWGFNTTFLAEFRRDRNYPPFGKLLDPPLSIILVIIIITCYLSTPILNLNRNSKVRAVSSLRTFSTPIPWHGLIHTLLGAQSLLSVIVG